MVAVSKTKGYAIHRARLKRMARIKDPAIKALANAGEAVRADAQKSIRDGAISGAGHIPSAPGDPPNADTHNLDLSIDVRINSSKLTVSVTAMARYAAALEFGTSRISPRPFLRPALLRNKNRLVFGFAQAVRDTNSGKGVRVYKSDSAFLASRARYEKGG